MKIKFLLCSQNFESTPHESQNSNPFQLFKDQTESYVGQERSSVHYITLVLKLYLRVLRFCWQPWDIIISCDLCTILLVVLLFLKLLFTLFLWYFHQSLLFSKTIKTIGRLKGLCIQFFDQLLIPRICKNCV